MNQIKILNFLGFRNRSQSISDYPVKKFWKLDDFWASSNALEKIQLKVGHNVGFENFDFKLMKQFSLFTTLKWFACIASVVD